MFSGNVLQQSVLALVNSTHPSKLGRLRFLRRGKGVNTLTLRYMDLSYSCPFSFPSSKSVLKKVSKLLLLSPSPNGKKTFCKPLDSYLVRKGPGDSVRKAGLVGGQPIKQARAQIGATDRVRHW